MTPLHHAAGEANNTEVIRILLAAGAEVNVQSEYYGVIGSTPLHRAAGQANNTEVIRMLLEAGADVHAKDPRIFNRTPLMVAV